MKIKLTFNKPFIAIITILFLCSLATLYLSGRSTFDSEKFDSYKEMKDKLLSKKALENFIINHRVKGNFKYTKDNVLPLLADKKNTI